MKDDEAVRVRVTGRVQGVSFRAWAQSEARKLGIAGWVRNEADGSVSALLVGSKADVASLVERLRAGPPAARVVEMQIAATELKDRPKGFRITG